MLLTMLKNANLPSKIDSLSKKKNLFDKVKFIKYKHNKYHS